MGIEIERKFLVKNTGWQDESDAGQELVQGYMVGGVKSSVRVRIEGDRAFLNIKSATLGVTRMEYEYPIPVSDAREMLVNLCDKPLIEKNRYLVHKNGLVWEIDVFKGDNAGLVVAEVELQSQDQTFEKPEWLGEEVSHDPRYYNVNLTKHPFKDW